MFVQQGRRSFGARSVRRVREHGKVPTCLREAAPAKAGNAAGGSFDITQGMLLQHSTSGYGHHLHGYAHALILLLWHPAHSQFLHQN